MLKVNWVAPAAIEIVALSLSFADIQSASWVGDSTELRGVRDSIGSAAGVGLECLRILVKSSKLPNVKEPFRGGFLFSLRV